MPVPAPQLCSRGAGEGVGGLGLLGRGRSWLWCQLVKAGRVTNYPCPARWVLWAPVLGLPCTPDPLTLAWEAWGRWRQERGRGRPQLSLPRCCGAGASCDPKSLLDNSSGKLGNFGWGVNRVRRQEGWKNQCLNRTRGVPCYQPLPSEPLHRGSAAHRWSRGGSRGGGRIWGLLNAAGSG